MRRIKWILISLAVAIAGAELCARVAFDFPLYGADSELGYWVLPDQQGSFLFTNDWAFDREGLGVAEEFRPSSKLDVLLVGDSLVYGGNRLRQSDKLGPMLEARTGWQVWPAAAGSWGLQNELTLLRRKPELVAGADVIVFVSNSGDFGAPSEWRSPYTHPRARPAFYLTYLFDRYVRKPAAGASPYPVPQRDVSADWANFVRTAGKPVFVVAYSAPEESGQGCDWVPRAFRQAGSWICYDGLAQLGPEAFQDDIHPSPAGNKGVAARIISVMTGIGSSEFPNAAGTTPRRADARAVRLSE